MIILGIEIWDFRRLTLSWPLTFWPQNYLVSKFSDALCNCCLIFRLIKWKLTIFQMKFDDFRSLTLSWPFELKYLVSQFSDGLCKFCLTFKLIGRKLTIFQLKIDFRCLPMNDLWPYDLKNSWFPNSVMHYTIAVQFPSQSEKNWRFFR